ncbi:nitroreductase family protein [Thiomicrorhabdus aquaedulcis]|uniref:nitroreductase family protein n=1 Tax=Thiomicrorhabdus aquaedulcis TaxID=2211106 RepID=UPI000FD6C527|nr:nitroreductase family protein [Thiomicrorhabdus aquaedulcis]
MSTFDPHATLSLIQARRTCYQFMDRAQHPVLESEIAQCLAAAVCAPNHKLTQPWVFWVLGQQTQAQLAHIYAQLRAQKNTRCDDLEYEQCYENARLKFNAIGQVVLVGQTLNTDLTVQKEDYAACACAIQNWQLMAWSLNIGVQWSTGPILNDARTLQILNVPHNTSLIGALYMGKINADCAPKNTLKRKTIAEVTTYLP